VISKKKFFIDFLDELELFIGEKQVFTKKNFRRSAVCRLPSAVCRLPSAICRDFMAVQMRILSARFLKEPFKLDTSAFGSLKELV
jgi:hypothetical protein